MAWHPHKGDWQIDEVAGVSVNEVAARLAREEPLDRLRYRHVELLAVIIDVNPCRTTTADTRFRLVRLQPADKPPPVAAHPQALPERWQSAPIPIPCHPRAGLEAGLARVETGFEMRTFLKKVAREIDAALEHAARREPCPRRPARAQGATENTEKPPQSATLTGSPSSCARRLSGVP